MYNLEKLICRRIVAGCERIRPPTSQNAMTSTHHGYKTVLEEIK